MRISTESGYTMEREERLRRRRELYRLRSTETPEQRESRLEARRERERYYDHIWSVSNLLRLLWHEPRRMTKYGESST